MQVFVNDPIFISSNVFINSSLEMVAGFTDEVRITSCKITIKYTKKDFRY